MPQVSAEPREAAADWIGRPRADSAPHDFAGLAEVMAVAMTGAAGPPDGTTLRADREGGSAEPEAGTREASGPRPHDLARQGLPEAGRELEEVVAQTEEASNAIMSACEDILAADPSDSAAYQALVADRVTAIFEACAFQDLAGQRIGKVLRTLRDVDGRIEALAERLRLADDAAAPDAPSGGDVRARALLLFGPQARAVAQSQEEIDLLFSEVVTQDEIDTLFARD